MSAKEKIFVTRIIHADALAFLQSWAQKNHAEVKVWPHPLPPTREELIKEASDASAILSMITDRIDGHLFQALPKLKIVSNHAVGVDNIDLSAAQHAKVAVGNTPDVLTAATAELGLILTMALLRQLPSAIRQAQTNQWPVWGPLLDLTMQIGGMEKDDDAPVFGIYGMGRIGQYLGRILSVGLNAQVTYTNTQGPLSNLNFAAQWKSSEDLLSQCDVLIVTCPSNPSTKGLFNATTLRKLKKGAYFINIARGDLHDEKVLIELLDNGHLAGVALDVLSPEPGTLGRNPILSHPKALVTPHIGSATHRTRRKMGIVAARNITAFLSGQTMPHPVPTNLN